MKKIKCEDCGESETYGKKSELSGKFVSDNFGGSVYLCEGCHWEFVMQPESKWYETQAYQNSVEGR